MIRRFPGLVRRAALVFAASIVLSASAQAHGPWQVMKGCREIPNDSNDGDSFHVRALGTEYIFRLYFADAPETELSFPQRVGEQAKYFRLTTPQTLELGRDAKRFVEEKLSRPFTVRTCLQDALGRSKRERFYAFIETDEGDLAEMLVANGLARVHGNAAAPIGLSSPEREWEKLRRLETEARQEKVGGWGATFGRMALRLTRQPAKTGADSFEAFFHPNRLVAPMTTPAPASSSAVASKLDVNLATSAELMNLNGIGPVLAERIVQARPFKSADDLRRVKGIGPKKYEQIRPAFADVPAPSSAKQ